VTTTSGVTLTIVGLHGQAGSGKSTVARQLVKYYGAVPLGFADYFKIPAVVSKGLNPAEVFGPLPKSHGTRRLLQLTGTELGRELHGPNVRVDHLLTHLYRREQMGVSRVVVDDVRFPNEADAIRHAGGQVWRVTGRGGLTGTTGEHASEIPLADALVDVTMQNQGSLDDLEQLTRSLAATQLGWAPLLKVEV